MATSSNITGRVKDILDRWTIPEAERAAAPLRLSPKARAFWVKRYTPKFAKALKDGRTWEFDGKHVLKSSARLGRAALRYARKNNHASILEEDARQASIDNDCPALAAKLARRAKALGAAELLAFWCR